MNRKTICKAASAHGAFLLLLMLLAIVVNYHTEILGLYQDDLYLWTRYGNHSALGYIFQTGTSRFRPVWEFLAYITLKAAGTHTQWLAPINIGVNGCIAGLVYGLGYAMGKNRPVAFLAGFAFLLSRFSYYQIGMVLGGMESAAMVQALCLLYCLYRFVGEAGQEKGDGRCGIWAIVLFFTLSFTHERYMVLVLLVLAVFLAKRSWKLAGGAVLVFGLVQLIRWWAIGTVLPPGAGHTTVAETFHLSQALSFAASQVLYLFGISAGPDYLSGKSWAETSLAVRGLVAVSILVLLAECFLFVLALVKEKDKRRRLRRLAHIGLFFGFIALCIGSSSVTIRVEMRWVYVSYGAALVFLCYIYGAVAGSGGRSLDGSGGLEAGAFPGMPEKGPVSRRRRGKGFQAALACGLLFLCYALLLVPIEGYYRGERKNLYYWSNQRRANSLEQVTYGKYGDDFFHKQVYLLDHSFGLDDYTLNNFFRVYRKDKKPGIPAIHLVSSMDDFGLVGEDMVVLAEDKEDNTYVDVTDFVREEKFKRIQGCYPDGWLDQHSQFVVKAGREGKVLLRFYYPGKLKGGEKVVVREDGKVVLEIPMDQPSVERQLAAMPFEKLNLSVDCNFSYQDAPERRGKDPMAVVLQVETP